MKVESFRNELSRLVKATETGIADRAVYIEALDLFMRGLGADNPLVVHYASLLNRFDGDWNNRKARRLATAFDACTSTIAATSSSVLESRLATKPSQQTWLTVSDAPPLTELEPFRVELQPRKSSFADVLTSGLPPLPAQPASEPIPKTRARGHRIFLSHSSKDRVFVALLFKLLRSAFTLRPQEILCTSMPGSDMRSGDDIDETLRDAVLNAEVVIGVLSDMSLESLYVASELGARWGTKKPLLPVFVSGFEIDKLGGPLRAYLGRRSNVDTDMLSLVDDVGKKLGTVANSPSSYHSELRAVVDFKPASADDEPSVADSPISPLTPLPPAPPVPPPLNRSLLLAAPDRPSPTPILDEEELLYPCILILDSLMGADDERMDVHNLAKTVPHDRADLKLDIRFLAGGNYIRIWDPKNGDNDPWDEMDGAEPLELTVILEPKGERYLAQHRMRLLRLAAERANNK